MLTDAIEREKDKIYEEFKNEFPLERVRNLTLEEYTNTDRTNSFCYWVEKKTEKLGSIWGGSAYKFGIFKIGGKIKGKKGTLSDDEYAWYSKYGGKMKNKILNFVFMLIIAANNISAEENILSVFGENKTSNLNKHLKNGLISLELDINSSISSESLAVINYILKNTYENNIHKMRGEDDNVVYTKDTGEEVVFDKNKQLVTNAWNKGSYNYGNYNKPIEKFMLDIWPWLNWGNTRDDPTTFEERLYYYIMDLDIGIQSYIFLEDKSKLTKIKFNELNENEKCVYHLFNYLLFNKNYKYKLDNKGIEQYQKTSDQYWKYLSQILELIGYEN